MRRFILAAMALTIVGSAGAQTKQPLVQALRRRLMTAGVVVIAKFNSGAPVEDKVREAKVITRAVTLGKQMGLDPGFVRRVFQAQIEANKMVQRSYLAEWKGNQPFKAVPDLAKVVRPELDRLTLEIIKGMSAKAHWTANDFSGAPGDYHYTRAWQVATGPFRPFLTGPKAHRVH